MKFGPLELIKRTPKTRTLCYARSVAMPVIPGFSYTHRMADGWGNGYVALPPNHRHYKASYEDINSIFRGRLPECLTWSRKSTPIRIGVLPGRLWVVGFDTMHAWNNNNVHTKEWVIKATVRLEYLLNETDAMARRRKLKKRNVSKKKKKIINHK